VKKYPNGLELPGLFPEFRSVGVKNFLFLVVVNLVGNGLKEKVFQNGIQHQWRHQHKGLAV